MTEVVESFRKVAVLVEEISHASREQSAGIEQVVTLAVGQMDDVTQQNAALVEEAAAAAESLKNRRGDSSRRSGCSDSLRAGRTTGSHFTGMRDGARAGAVLARGWRGQR